MKKFYVAATELLGEIVTWEMRAGDYAVTQIQEALEDAGLDPSVVTELRITNAFSRATKHLKENRAIDRLKRTKDQVQYQLTAKNEVNEHIDYHYECVLDLNTETGEVYCGENEELATKAQELTAFARQTRNASDITRIIQRMFKSHAELYALNKHGAAYFVPIQHMDFNEKIQKFMATLGGKLERFPVPKGTEQGNQSVCNAVSSGLSELVSELDAAIDEWNPDTKTRTFTKAQERLDVIQHRVLAYAEYLESKQSELLERLEQTRGRLVEKVLEVAARDEKEIEEIEVEV